MSLALVEQLNFEKQMPIDGNCKQQIAISVPSTGASSYYLGSYFMINIPRAGPDYVFDPMNSFLRFKASVVDQAGVLSIDHSANSFIQKLEVLHAGNVLETIDNYQQLSAILIDTQVESSARKTNLNMTVGCSATNNLLGTTITNGAANGKWFSITLLSGIVGSLARNYIPVNDLQGSIQIRFTFSSYNQVGKWTTDLHTANNEAISFSNIEFHGNFISLSPEVMSMVRTSEYTIYSETYSNFQQTIASTCTQLEQLLPSRYSSLKTVFVGMRASTSALNATHQLYPNSRSSFGITDYCFRLGPEQIPPTRIRCTGYGFLEPFEALKTSLHAGVNALSSMGVLNSASFVLSAPSAVDEANYGLFVIGQDFETFSGKSGSILSGASTLGNDLMFSANYGAMAAAIFDFFLHYDMKLIIKDGVLTVHV